MVLTRIFFPVFRSGGPLLSIGWIGQKQVYTCLYILGLFLIFNIWELRTSRYDKNTLPRCGNIFHTRKTSFWELFFPTLFDTFQDVNLFRSWQSLSHYFLANSTYFASLPNRFELPNTLKYGIGVAIASQGQILSPKHWPLLAHPQPGGRRPTGSGGFGGAKLPPMERVWKKK